MNLKTIDIDTLIDIFSSLSKQKNEFTEQDATGGDSSSSSTTSSSGGGSPSVPKWADTYPIKRGKANMLGKQGEKWETGMTRGPANQIW